MTEDPAPYGNPPVPDTRTTLARFFEAASCRTQCELADFLGVKQSSISDQCCPAKRLDRRRDFLNQPS